MDIVSELFREISVMLLSLVAIVCIYVILYNITIAVIVSAITSKFRRGRVVRFVDKYIRSHSESD